MEHPRAARALGMPVPPARLAALGERLRNGIARAHRRAAPAPLVVIERMTAIVEARLIALVVEVDIPDLIEEAPRTADDLAAATGSNSDALARILRYLAGRGWFAVDATERYSNTELGRSLVRGEWSWRGWVEYFGSHWNWDLWTGAGHSLRTGRGAAPATLGQDFFEFVANTDPTAGEAFNDAMTAGGRMQGLLVIETFDFGEVQTVCDVGGGDGIFIADLVATHPAIRGVTFDLPALSERANLRFSTRGVQARAAFTGGDFFTAVPEGHDLYTLFSIVHDWDDEAAVSILERVARALPERGRALVVERVIPSHHGDDFAKLFDVVMLVTNGGRERTVAEYDALFRRAGLRPRTARRIASGSTVFEVVRARRPA